MDAPTRPLLRAHVAGPAPTFRSLLLRRPRTPTLEGSVRRTLAQWFRSVFVPTAAAIVALGYAACGGEPPERAAAIAERAAEAASAEEPGSSAARAGLSDAGTPLLRGLPDSCPLLTAVEASEILGAETSTPEGAGNEGRAGSLCRYVADSDHRMGFELFMLPLAVWHPDTGSLEELAALTDRTRSSMPEARIWEDGPGLGGYYAEEEDATTAWLVTPYGFTPGMGNEATSQVYLRVFVYASTSADARLDALSFAAERIIPRIGEG